MKNLFTLLIFFTITAKAQNSEKNMFYDAVTKTLHLSQNISINETDITNLSEPKSLEKFWNNASNGFLTSLFHTDTNFISENGSNISTLDNLLGTTKNRIIGISENRSYSSLYPINSILSNYFSQNLNIQSDSLSETPFSCYLCSNSQNALNEIINTRVFRNDSNTITFSSFQSIDEPIYKNRTEISSFEFKDMLSDAKGRSWIYRTTNFSNSISSNLSAGLGNGGLVTETGIYETNWKGSDNLSYAVLKAPLDNQSVSLTLNPSANLSNNNERGYFTIQQLNGNSFSLGTLSSSQGVIGFKNTEGTTLELYAGTIETSGLFLHHGVLNTTTLIVSNENSNGSTLNQQTLASFNSYSQNGGEIKINSLSASASAISALSLLQGGIANRIATYPINNNSFLSGSFAFEGNSPNGMIFSIDPVINNEAPSFRFIIKSKEVVSISTRSVSIANAFHLDGITEEEMHQQEPQEGTIIYNSTRKRFMAFDGEGWGELDLKNSQTKKKPVVENQL